MTVCAHIVVIHEQLASEGFVVEVISEIAHHLFKIISHPFDELKVVAFINDVPGDREAASTEWEKTLLRYLSQLVSGR